MPSEVAVRMIPMAVTGADLVRDGARRMRDLLGRGAIAPGPSEAVERIRQRNEIAGEITTEVLLSRCPDLMAGALDVAPEDRAAALAHVQLTAPHTHWPDDATIVIEPDARNDRLLIGRNAIVPDDLYFAVGCVLVDGQALPFEWLHGMTGIDRRALEAFWRLCGALATRVDTLETGLGLGFEYRTTLLSGDIPNPTIECDLNDDLGVIYTEAGYDQHVGLDDLVGAEAVAWPLMAGLADTVLSPAEAEALSSIRATLAAQPDAASRNAMLARVLGALD